jgi:nifR3 family TIM-barrel protein
MLHISGCKVDPPFLLAPLAGYSDLPFRLLCREFGAGMCVSEMISCHGIMYEQKKTLSMLASTSEERPTAFQLFGADPEIMGKAAAYLVRYSPECIDINMGCPVRKVTKNGAGVALMANPSLAEKIISRVRDCSGLPVTVKFRSGIDSNHLNAVPFAKMAEEAGASAITIHGRTWAQGFTGRADRNIISQVKQAVSIPVIGNGDITSFQEGIALMDETGCDGVMIGRAALGNPWVFQKSGKPADLLSVLRGIYRHVELIDSYLHPTDRMLGSLKNIIGRYFKHLPGSASLRKIIYESPSYSALKQNLVSLQCEYNNRE